MPVESEAVDDDGQATQEENIDFSELTGLTALCPKGVGCLCCSIITRMGAGRKRRVGKLCNVGKVKNRMDWERPLEEGDFYSLLAKCSRSFV